MKRHQRRKGGLSKRVLQSYLNRLVDGKLSHEELENVASDLTNPDDLFMRVSILAKSFDPRYIPVFEKFVIHTDDLDVAGVALRALIDFHGRLEYLPLLMKYIEGVIWDMGNSLKLRGIHIADAYLEENKDPALISLLIKQFEESDDSIIREAAHEALMSAANIDRRDVAITIAARGMTDADLRLDVIERLKKGRLPS